MNEQIDTGDYVLHGPTGETWLVARVDGKLIAWCGWPPGWADLSDCTLVEKATPEKRDELLRSLASGSHHCAGWARERMAEAMGERAA